MCNGVVILRSAVTKDLNDADRAKIIEPGAPCSQERSRRLRGLTWVITTAVGDGAPIYNNIPTNTNEPWSYHKA